MTYALCDGDNIGDAMEILLLEGRVSEAIIFSDAIKEALNEIVERIHSIPSAEIVYCAGDELLFRYDGNATHEPLYAEVMGVFYEKTGHSMSCGLGHGIPDAVRNLYLAKLYGKNQARGPE